MNAVNARSKKQIKVAGAFTLYTDKREITCLTPTMERSVSGARAAACAASVAITSTECQVSPIVRLKPLRGAPQQGRTPGALAGGAGHLEVIQQQEPSPVDGMSRFEFSRLDAKNASVRLPGKALRPPLLHPG